MAKQERLIYVYFQPHISDRAIPQQAREYGGLSVLFVLLLLRWKAFKLPP